MPNVLQIFIRLFTCCFLISLFCSPCCGQAKLRTWNEPAGDRRIRASFIGVDQENVILQLEDGQEILIPIERLHSTDRAYIRQKTREQGKQSVTTTNFPSTDGSVDWHQWRGPRRDGISSEIGLLDQWPSAGPPVAWQTGGLGNGFSSIAIADGRLYTTGKRGDDTNLIARDVNTGQRLWETWIGRGGDAPNSTPTVDGNLVFALSFQGDLLCADSKSGREIWRLNLQQDLGGKMMSQWGYSESVLVDGDRLIVTPGAPDAAMVALNKRTGQVIWRTVLPPNPGPAGQDGAGYSSIVISEARGIKQYVQLVGRGLIGVDAANGNLLWVYNRIANTTANVPTPIVSGDYIFCSSGYDDGGSALLEIKGSKPRINVHEVYYKPARELQNHHGGMILLGDQVYMGHGHNNGFPVCFDLKTGRDRWRPGRGAGTGSAAVLYADGHLYFRYENGIMALIEATPEEYRLKGKFRIAINNGQSWPHPVIYQGKLFLRDQQELICYDIQKR